MAADTHLKVKQIMSKGIVTCRPQASLEDVAQLMSDSEVSAVVVVDDDGTLKGLISQFDLLAEYGSDLSAKAAKDLMTVTPIAIGPEDQVEDAAQEMLKKKIHRLIVIDQDAPRASGVISVSDIIRTMRSSRVSV